MKRLVLILCALALLAIGAAQTVAQDDDPFPFITRDNAANLQPDSTVTLDGWAMLSWTPDSQALAVLQSSESKDEPGILYLYDPRALDDAPEVFSDQLAGATSLAFSPDGTLLAVGYAYAPVQLWRVETAELLATLDARTAYTETLAFSPDGTLLAAANYDHGYELRLWDVASGALLYEVAPDSNGVNCVVFTADGSLMATSGTASRVIEIWDVETGALVHTLSGHRDEVRSIAFSPDGTGLLSGSGDSTARLWDVETGETLMTIDTEGHASLPSLARLSPLAGHSGGVWAVGFSPDGTALYTASGDGLIRLWDAATGEFLVGLPGDSMWVQDALFSPDGRMLASRGTDGNLIVWAATYRG